MRDEAHNAGVIPTFLGAAVFGLLLMIIVRVVPGLQISIDFTKSLSFESAPVSIFAQSLDPSRSPAPQDGPVSITAEFDVDPTRRNECIELMRDARMIFLRNGANRWHLCEDPEPTEQIPNGSRGALLEAALTPTRMDDKERKEVLLKLRSLRTDPNPPEEWISLSVEKEVLNRRVRSGGLPPDYIDQ